MLAGVEAGEATITVKVLNEDDETLAERTFIVIVTVAATEQPEQNIELLEQDHNPAPEDMERPQTEPGEGEE
ncbi:hypothetical protein D7X33_17570 [Butyricicoccus sp. 1XD8-22]|nr:hypothetical protein D7X33_17570 [Butyricicoccus sp. 1XD8-22]